MGGGGRMEEEGEELEGENVVEGERGEREGGRKKGERE